MLRKTENGVKRVAFDDQSVRNLTAKLDQIAQVSNIQWEFRGDELIVTGLDDEPVTFGHWKSATAFIDGYLMGYNHGFGDGRRQ